MRLSKIQLRNFRCFEDTTVDLHPNCTVIAGVNGSGKSSVLEGLALCLGQWLSLYGLRSPVIRPEHVRLEQREINRQVFLDKSFPVEVDASWEHEGGYSITNVRLEREGLLTEFPIDESLNRLSIFC